jgi:hypothetical protein
MVTVWDLRYFDRIGYLIVGPYFFLLLNGCHRIHVLKCVLLAIPAAAFISIVQPGVAQLQQVLELVLAQLQQH